MHVSVVNSYPAAADSVAVSCDKREDFPLVAALRNKHVSDPEVPNCTRVCMSSPKCDVHGGKANECHTRIAITCHGKPFRRSAATSSPRLFDKEFVAQTGQFGLERSQVILGSK